MKAFDAVFIPICHFKAVKDDIFSELFDYDCVTLYKGLEKVLEMDTFP